MIYFTLAQRLIICHPRKRGPLSKPSNYSAQLMSEKVTWSHLILFESKNLLSTLEYRICEYTSCS